MAFAPKESRRAANDQSGLTRAGPSKGPVPPAMGCGGKAAFALRALAQAKELPVPLRACVAPRLRFGRLAGGAERGSSTKREGRLSGRPELGARL